MPSLKAFRQMSGLPDSIRRWSDAAEQVKAGQKALAEQARGVPGADERGQVAPAVPIRGGVINHPTGHVGSNPTAPAKTEPPMDWHPQVNRKHAEADGRKPEDFRWEQWPLSNVRLEPSENWRIPFWYACDYAEGTPLDNQYVQDGDGYRKLPDPVGMCLQSVFFRLVDPDTGAQLDEQDTLPAEGKVLGRANEGSRVELWRRLRPADQPGGHNTLKVKVVAFPRFYFLAEDGGMQGHYAIGNRGHFLGAEVESPVHTLSMDHDGNVTVSQ